MLNLIQSCCGVGVDLPVPSHALANYCGRLEETGNAAIIIITLNTTQLPQ
jgi:hypothetical protein